ncbi:MAG: arginyltransferase [Planctomycetota bacterium]
MTAELFSIVSPPSSCSYLPEERSRMGVKFFSAIDGEHYSALLARGWRRQGMSFFRADCPECRKCRSLRVDVKNFRPTKSQRRCLKRNAHISLVVRPAEATPAHAELYNRWHADMHRRRGWDDDRTSVEQYRDNLVGPGYAFSKEFAYYDGERLVGVGLVDAVPDSLNSIYFMYDPAWRPSGPGTFSALSEIQYARETGRDWVYLGYWIKEHASMAYKNRFAPHQILTERVSLSEPPPWRTPAEPSAPDGVTGDSTP